MADHKLHAGMLLYHIQKPVRLPALTAAFAYINDKHQTMFIRIIIFGLHDIPVQGQREMVGHEPRAGTYLKLHNWKTQLFKQVFSYLFLAPAKRVVGSRGTKPVRIFFHCLHGIEILETKVISLEQHCFLHSVIIHFPENIPGSHHSLAEFIRKHSEPFP